MDDSVKILGRAMRVFSCRHSSKQKKREIGPVTRRLTVPVKSIYFRVLLAQDFGCY